MGRVIGLGGLFLKCKDADATKAWYRDVLGMAMNEWGGFDFIHQTSAEKFPTGARTIFSQFGDDTDYFVPSEQPFMLNLMVDDLDGVLATAEAAGAKQLQTRESHEYGHFAWLLDPDGRKVELWQPIEPAE